MFSRLGAHGKFRGDGCEFLWACGVWMEKERFHGARCLDMAGAGDCDGNGGEGGVLVQSVPFARRVDGDIRRIRLISKPISQLEF